MDITFLGATQTVTGSKYLIKAEGLNILVDCGLFQGYKELRLRNWNVLPINPADINCILLTHAHIDHTGYIPLLVKNGFVGKIYCTEATRDLCEVLLPDSGYLQEEEARYANRKGFSKHTPALPLYTQQDAENALRYFEVVSFNAPLKIKDNLTACFYYGGHILGASTIRIEHYDVSVLFSGDLGRQQDPIMYPPKPPVNSTYLVIESTYGNRLHDKDDPEVILTKAILRSVNLNGVILIPAFAVGRAQTMLYYLHQLKKQNKIPDIPVYIDSPMAVDATKLFCHHADQHRLSVQETAEVCRTAQYIHSVEESKELATKTGPMIIISASGMATGGRVVHHLQHYVSNPNNTIIFCGFQASGTRGDRLVRGESEIKLFGKMIPVNATIIQLHNLSAHADYAELLTWLSSISTPPRKVFITHGELDAAESLKKKIEEKFKWPCVVPEYLYTQELT